MYIPGFFRAGSQYAECEKDQILCLMVYYIIVSVLFLLFFWCPCMAINVSVQCNGGLLPDIILVDPMLFPSRNPFKCHEEVLYCSL